MIGGLLNLPSETLDIIEHNNDMDMTLCCNAMLEKWLEADPSASCEKLCEVTKSLSVSSDQGIVLWLVRNS